MMVRLDISDPRWIFASAESRSILLEQIRGCQFEDGGLRSIRDRVLKGDAKIQTFVEQRKKVKK